LNPDDLDDRIAKARAAGRRPDPEGQAAAPDAAGNPAMSGGPAMGVGLRLGVEFVGALAVGGGLGWLAGRWLGSAPVGLLVGLLLGFAAGLLSVRRAMNAAYDPVTQDRVGGKQGGLGKQGVAGSPLATEMKDTEEDDAEPS
jgi:ATP synthase protein I